MSKTRFTLSLLALAAALLLLTAATPAWAGQDDGETVKIRKIVRQCEGDDCPEGEHRVVFVGDDGTTRVLEGDKMVWAHGPHMAHGSGFLGVAITDLTPELRRHFGVAEDAGVMVSRVEDDSPAARAGVLVGDVISAVAGEPVRSAGDLVRQIRRREPDTAVDLELWREGKLETVSATIGRREAPERHARRMIVRCPEGEECEQLHLGTGGGKEVHRIMVRCRDGEECDEIHVAGSHGQASEFDCGGAADCRVEVQCGDDGECSCVVNGETTDCATLPGFRAPGE